MRTPQMCEVYLVCLFAMKLWVETRVTRTCRSVSFGIGSQKLRRLQNLQRWSVRKLCASLMPIPKTETQAAGTRYLQKQAPQRVREEVVQQQQQQVVWKIIKLNF